jgi:glycosyltransferase involved in cell wall biosynthesis
MKLLYIGWADHVHLARWAGFFAAEGHRVWVLPFTHGVVPGCTTLPFFSRKRRISFQAFELNLYRRLLKVDLVHVHWAGFAYLPYCAGIRPYVITAWGSDIYRMGEYDAETQSRMTTALRNAALVTVDSGDIREAVIRLGVAPELVKVIQWGVDTELFRPGLATEELRHELRAEGCAVIYSPRNIEPVYNNNVILGAFATLLKSFPDTVLVQKHYKRTEKALAKYLALANSLGVYERVRLVGDMEYEQLPYLYNLADVVVSVPSSDATPMSVLEAMACGVFPVVSDLPSLREWLVDGEGGLFVGIGDAEGLADRLCHVLAHREQREVAGRVNREKVALKASHRGNMKQMERLYQQLAGAGTCRRN